MSDLNGFFALYYTGTSGQGATGVLMHNGRVYAVDPAGGTVSGTYAVNSDDSVEMDLLFHFAANTQLVTGQTLSNDIEVPFQVIIKKATFLGEVQTIEFPFGLLNIRFENLTVL